MSDRLGTPVTESAGESSIIPKLSRWQRANQYREAISHRRRSGYVNRRRDNLNAFGRRGVRCVSKS